MQSLRPAHYLLGMLAAMLSVIGLAWVYVVAAPMAFLPGGYPNWVAKMDLLDQCRLGEIMFLGDSRVEAGVIPAALPMPAINIGLAGGTPVEFAVGVQRALRCAVPPRMVVMAPGVDSFGPLTEIFWQNSVRYGHVSFDALLDLERRASAVDDWETLTHAVTPEGLSGRPRDWLYAARFPSVFFSNLMQARISGRSGINAGRLRDVEASRGYIPYPAGQADDVTGPESSLPRFSRTKLQDAVLEAALAALRDRGVVVLLLHMPIKTATRAAMRPGVESDYMAHLDALAERFPNVRVAGRRIPAWPNTMFADRAHLNPAGARRFTDLMAACLQGASYPGACDFDWHDGHAAITMSPLDEPGQLSAQAILPGGCDAD